MHVQLDSVARGDPRRFLAAMLQRVQTEIGQLGGFRMAEDAEHAAVIVEVVVVEACGVCESCALECFPERFAPDLAERIDLPLYHGGHPSCWMRNSPRRDRADSPTLDIILCRNSIDAGKRQPDASDTTARAPRSPKSADFGRRSLSSGAGPSFTSRPKGPRLAAKQDSATVTARPPSLTSCAETMARLAREFYQAIDQPVLRGEIDRRGRAGNDSVNGLRIFGGGKLASVPLGRQLRKAPHRGHRAER